jgi:hypothetical protein
MVEAALAQTSNGGSALFGLFIVLGLATVGGIAYWAYLRQRKRREAFALLARQQGLSYSPEDVFGILDEPFVLLQKGDGRGAENVLSGTWQSMPLRAFDYWYYEESTDSNGNRSKSYYRFDCIIVPIEAACSPLTIDHENLLTRIADAVALHDIELESEEFNRAFNIKGPDRKFANDLLDARMMSWLLEHADGYAFEVAGDRVLCFCRKIDPMALLSLFGTMKGFLDHVPRVVYDLYPKA